MKSLISVIVPVYNVEKYLKKCIDSIRAQTYSNIEIILIDDGSTDTSGSICDEYANNFENIKVFHKKNGGLMSAWKYGFEHALGEYIGFVDSDDWIEAEMYDKLLSALKSTKSDIAVAGLIKGEYIYVQPSIFKGIVKSEDTYCKLINDGSFMGRGIIPSRVVKLFKSKIVKNVIPYCIDIISLGEDMVMNFAAFMFADRVVFLNDFFPYHYRVNLNSITQKFDYNIFDKVMLFENQLVLISKLNKYDFSLQLNADLGCNVINIIERICHSDIKYNEKKKYISEIYLNKKNIEIFKSIDCRKWSIRYRIYHILFIRGCFDAIIRYGILIEKLRKVKRVLKNKG